MTLRMEILVNEELLKDRLTPCREVCPILLDLFIWRKDVYPCILVGAVTSIFGLIWYYDPSVVTAFSVLGLILTVGDYLLPLVSKSVSTADSWNSEKEKKFSILVNRVTFFSVQVWNFQVTLEEWKKEYPNAYSSTLIVVLLFMAWIGNAVNNLFLTYLFVVFLALLPGLLHRRILHVYVSKIVLFVSNLIGSKAKKN
ncbi:ADP-ribosylation factor-like protein 6-interacting protein 1 [Folsomia candida]|uniref:ADP-ribosylation factor-like protein 6-interacting protein 1 n=1 Tax=Folsomia candida TaxID=158441 RepID=A0A226EE40_FOLCA|nr:ADP-ribosylation factor-like protein 6-interacting protein 1 [Folsomia candida]OXA55508.1 ADP-ribosylation factor-like protein 6-interacting protein 1 [Folsomia candida]